MVIWTTAATAGDASADSGRKARPVYAWSCPRALTLTTRATGGPARKVCTSMMAHAWPTDDEASEVGRILGGAQWHGARIAETRRNRFADPGGSSKFRSCVLQRTDRVVEIGVLSRMSKELLMSDSAVTESWKRFADTIKGLLEKPAEDQRTEIVAATDHQGGDPAPHAAPPQGGLPHSER